MYATLRDPIEIDKGEQQVSSETETCNDIKTSLEYSGAWNHSERHLPQPPYVAPPRPPITKDEPEYIFPPGTDVSKNISKNLQNMSINLFGLIEFTLKDGCDFMTELVGSELSNYATVNNGLYRSIPLGDDISLYMQSGNFVTSYPSVSITSEECWKLKAWTEYDGQLLLDSTIGNFDPSRIKAHLDFTFRP